MKRILLAMTIAMVSGCTIQTSTDIDRLGRIEKALETKADAQVVGQNFHILAQKINEKQDKPKVTAPTEK